MELQRLPRFLGYALRNEETKRFRAPRICPGPTLSHLNYDVFHVFFT